MTLERLGKPMNFQWVQAGARSVEDADESAHRLCVASPRTEAALVPALSKKTTTETLTSPNPDS